MKKVIAINGSPRKNWNTYMLLENCLAGAHENGAEIEMVNLYDLQYKGCNSCFVCKLKGSTVSKCAMKDDLEIVLQKICDSDALVLGSPIYLGNITGEMKSFMERLLFPYISYEGNPSTFGKKMNSIFFYTMNVGEDVFDVKGYRKIFEANKEFMERIFGTSTYSFSMATYQFDDYNKYAMTLIDGNERLKRRETLFVDECKRAFLRGKSIFCL